MQGTVACEWHIRLLIFVQNYTDVSFDKKFHPTLSLTQVYMYESNNKSNEKGIYCSFGRNIGCKVPNLPILKIICSSCRVCVFNIDSCLVFCRKAS